MATLAGSRGVEMACWFGTRMRAVVAVGAGTKDLIVVETNLHPGRRGVASLAIGGGRSMGAALPWGNAAVVAADALSRSALEAAIDVAGRALDAEMPASEREAGGEMVERSLLRAGACGEERCSGEADAEQDRKHPQYT